MKIVLCAYNNCDISIPGGLTVDGEVAGMVVVGVVVGIVEALVDGILVVGAAFGFFVVVAVNVAESYMDTCL